MVSVPGTTSLKSMTMFPPWTGTQGRQTRTAISVNMPIVRSFKNIVGASPTREGSRPRRYGLSWGYVPDEAAVRAGSFHHGGRTAVTPRKGDGALRQHQRLFK